MLLFEIDQCLRVDWDEEVSAIVDTWSSYSVSKKEFNKAIISKGLDFAISNNAKDWIVDSHMAIGKLPESVHSLIEKSVIPAFAQAGIKRFFSVTSRESALTRMTIMRYCEVLKSHNIQVYEFDGVTEIKKWIKNNPI